MVNLSTKYDKLEPDIVKRFQRKETLAFGELDLEGLGQAHFRHSKQRCRLIGLPGAHV